MTIWLPVLAAVLLLVTLIAGAKMHPFVAFVVTALFAAVLLGVPASDIPRSIEKGIGDMLGSLSVVIVLGAIFGKLVADSGAARRIAGSLIALFGSGRVTLAMTATGFVVGVPLFYNVGFVLMVPLIFSVAYQTKLPATYVGVPLLAGLSIAHGFLPPHPSPAALVTQFGADMGLTLIYGVIVGLPTLLIAGPLFATRLRHLSATPGALFASGAAQNGDDDLPGAGISFACALLPVVLIAGATLLGQLPGLGDDARGAIAFAGNPMIVLLVSLAVATAALGLARGVALARVMEGYGSAIRDISTILLIVAGAGALKQVFVDSGVSSAIGAQLAGLPLHPLVLGWSVALVIRVALGSATVAGLTAAGIVQPLVAATGVDANLMVLAIGAGSLMCSHVNDSGFWMFKEYFGLSLADTVRSWSLMETLVGVFGLAFVLLLNAAI